MYLGLFALLRTMTQEMKKNPLQGTFHRRLLPPPAISFSSIEGQKLFAEALNLGYLSGYFQLAEHFTTQGHPAFCGLGSLTMALNALLIDPGRIWQGTWRWFDESMLNCCESLEVVREKGITLSKLSCLANCNGANVTLKYGNSATLEEFRNDLKLISTLPAPSQPTVMVASYSRKVLKQTGIGHFSPIGGYHPEKDMVLIMDVARFKYPPHWVPAEDLFSALQTIDEETGKSRGYILLSASSRMYTECFCKQTNELQVNCHDEDNVEGTKDLKLIEEKLETLLSNDSEVIGESVCASARNDCERCGGK